MDAQHGDSKSTLFGSIRIDSPAKSENEAQQILFAVYDALKEKGYNPVNQLVGYILSGDPTYITSFNNARSLIRKLERDELLEEIVKFYLASDSRLDG